MLDNNNKIVFLLNKPDARSMFATIITVGCEA